MRAYWRDSRAPRYSLLFAFPLFVVYQVLVALEPAGAPGGVRSGADVILQDLFYRIAGARGPLLFLVCLLAVGVGFVLRDLRANGRDLRAWVLALMLAESILLALTFGVAVSALTSQLVRPTAALGAAQLSTLGPGTRLMLSLGAGLYEELLFRVLLVGTLAWVGRRLLG